MDHIAECDVAHYGIALVYQPVHTELYIFLVTLVICLGEFQIPITGAAIVILISAATSPTETTIGVAIALLLYIQIEAYLVAPNIMKKAVNVPTALIVVSALAGGALAGILGALLAIPTAATILLILREVWVPRQDKR